MSSLDTKYWFVFYTMSGHEFKVAERIKERNVEVFLPTITSHRRWSDRIKKITIPLFKNYVLINATEKGRLYAIQTEGVVKCVSFKGKPAIIPDKQIENIKLALEFEKEKIEVQDGYIKGQKVIIAEGPFVGVEGVVYFNEKNEKKLAITIEILNRSVIVTLPQDSVIRMLKKN